MDYEYLILNNSDEDNTANECASCPYKGELCNSQCMEIIEIYNPYINKQEVTIWEALLRYQLPSQLHIAFYKLDFRKSIGGFTMTYRNNYRNDNYNIKWTIAVYIKKHFSLTLGNVLLNAWC